MEDTEVIEAPEIEEFDPYEDEEPAGDGPKYADPIPLAEVFEDRALKLDGKIAFDQWSRFGPNLLRMSEGHQFWLGDWANYGDKHWGDDIYQVIDVDRFDLKTIENYRMVMAKIPPKERVSLSWTHHRIAAELPTISLIRKAFKRGIMEQMTTREFQRLVDELKPGGGDEDSKTNRKTVHSWNLSFSLPVDDEKTGDAIAAVLAETLEREFAERGISLDMSGVKISPSKS